MRFPVFKTIGETFAFMGANLLDLLRILWAPALLMAVVQMLVMPRYFDKMTAFMALGSEPDPTLLMQAAGALLPDMALMLAFDLVAYPVLFAGILKLALLDQRPPRVGYIGFGLEELRIIGTWALVFIIIFGLVLLGQIIGGAARAMGQLAGAAGQAVGIVLDGALLALSLWIAARLSLATPAAITERRNGVTPAWGATRGAMLALLLFWGTFLVGGFLIQSLQFNLLTPDLARIASEISAAETDGEQMEAMRRLNEATAASYDWSRPENLVRYLIQHLVGMTMLTIAAVAGAMAWRKLRPLTA
jgi:hypothetical protein